MFAFTLPLDLRNSLHSSRLHAATYVALIREVNGGWRVLLPYLFWAIPGLIWRGLLCESIGLCRAVGGAAFWTGLLLGSVLWRKVRAGPDSLPLLGCITDGQTSLLLRRHTNKHTHGHLQGPRSAHTHTHTFMYEQWSSNSFYFKRSKTPFSIPNK